MRQISTRYRRILAILVVCLAVSLAGCGNGWGTDGPADSNEAAENESPSDDLEDAQNSSQNESSSDEDTQDSDSTNSAENDNSASSGDDSSSSSSSTSSSSSSSDDGDVSPNAERTDSDLGSDDSSDASGDGASEGDDSSQDTSEESDSSGSDGEESDSSDGDGDGEEEEEDGDDRPVYDLTVQAGDEHEKPVEGAEITIERHSDGATTTRTTDETGSSTFPVYPGEYTVTGEDENGNSESARVTVEEDTEVTMLSLLPPFPEMHTLTVEVVDENGDPYPGVEVGGIGGVLPSGADAEVFGTTNEAGIVRFEVYHGHTYEMDAYPPGGDLIMKSVEINGDESIRFEVPRQEQSASDPGTGNESAAAG